MASLSQGRTAAAHCGLFTHKSVPVIFEPHCTKKPRASCDTAQNLSSSSVVPENTKSKYGTQNMPVDFYRPKTWSVILINVNSLRVPDSTALRKVFGNKAERITGDWRKLHNNELHDFKSSPDIIR